MEGLTTEMNESEGTALKIPFTTKPAVADPLIFVNTPLIYVNVDEMREDRAILNLRQIRYSVLKDIVAFGFEIDVAPRSRQNEIIKTLVRKQIDQETKRSSKNDADRIDFANQIFNGIVAVTDLCADIDIDDECMDICSEGITFDIIRRYENHPQTNLLTNCWATSWNGCVSYSQLRDQPNLLEQARVANNDTDLNRIYFVLDHFHRTMLFDQMKSCNTMIKMLNLAMLFLLIVDNSTPVEGYNIADIHANLFCFMIDVFVRSRVISKWRLSKSSRVFLSEIVYNYNRDNLMVALCRLETAKERANFIVKTLASDERTKPLTKFLSYDEYEKKLNCIKIEIDGEEYYNFGNSFFSSLMTDSATQNIMRSADLLNTLADLA